MSAIRCGLAFAVVASLGAASRADPPKAPAQPVAPDGLDALLRRKDGPYKGIGGPFNPTLSPLPLIPPTYERVAFSPDGKTLAATRIADPFCAIHLWSVEDGKLLKGLHGKRHLCYGLTFTPDGKSLIAAPGTNTADAGKKEKWRKEGIQIWDPKQGKLSELLECESGATAIALSGDGKMLVSATHTEPLIIWDLAAGKETKKLKSPRHFVTALAANADGSLIASASPDEVRVWVTKTGEYTSFKAPKGRRHVMEFSGDARTLLVGTSEGLIQRCDLTTQKAEVTELKSDEPILCLSLSPDQKTAATGGIKGTVSLWDLATGKQTATLSEHQYPVSVTAFSPDGKLVVSGSSEPGLKIDAVRAAADKPDPQAKPPAAPRCAKER